MTERINLFSGDVVPTNYDSRSVITFKCAATTADTTASITGEVIP